MDPIWTLYGPYIHLNERVRHFHRSEAPFLCEAGPQQGIHGLRGRRYGRALGGAFLIHILIKYVAIFV